MLLSGEPGIGKSRLVQALKEQVAHEGAITHRVSLLALSPEQCLLSGHRPPAAAAAVCSERIRLQAKLEKLQQTLAPLSLPPGRYSAHCWPPCSRCPIPRAIHPLTLSPQKQKQKTQEALVAWLVEEAEQAAVYCAWEDLHWADPSTLEVLTLLLDQVPTTRLLVAADLSARVHAALGQPLAPQPADAEPLRPRTQVEAMVEKVTGGKPLPAEVVQQIVSQDRWRAVVCRRVDQDGGGVGVAHERQTGTMSSRGPLPPLGDSRHVAGFADGAARSAWPQSKRSRSWERPRTRVFL